MQVKFYQRSYLNVKQKRREDDLSNFSRGYISPKLSLDKDLRHDDIGHDDIGLTVSLRLCYIPPVGSVAQLAEQGTHKPLVLGPNPSAATYFLSLFCAFHESPLKICLTNLLNFYA